MGILGYGFILLIDIILPWFIWMTMGEGLWPLALLAGIILTVFNIVFLRPKAFPYRYLFPGILCFFLFMVLPIFFTIYIGFTNWGTGHMVSATQSKSLLLAERYLPEGERTFPFSLVKIDKGTAVELTDSGTTYQQLLDSKDGALYKKTGDSTPLSKRLYVDYLSFLKTKQFILNGQKLSLHGLTSLAPMKSRYSEIEGGDLKDNLTGDLFTMNTVDGFFQNDSEKLLPGFTVGVGLQNFTKLFNDPNLSKPFFKIFTWTFVWAFLTVAFTFSLGMLLALILNRKSMHLRVIYRILLIIPYSIPFFISVLVFKGMYNKDFGVINEIMHALFNVKIDWLNNGFWAKISCLIVNLWLGFPYMLLLLTGILQSIPGDIYEAAEIDGASKWVSFRKITLPLVFSSIGPLLVGSFAFNFNNFVGIYLLTGGNPPMEGVMTPAGETDILISYTYRLAFEGGQGQDFGLASAMAILIFAVIALLTILNFRLSGVIGPKKKKVA